MRHSKIQAIDFFCGAGGLTRGLTDSGITVLAGIDNDARLRKTYEGNNKGSKFFDGDINDIDICQLRQELGITLQDVVLYAACTPCQPFSTLNQRRGEDERKDLLLAFGKLVVKAPPDYVLVENVPGLPNAYGREIYKKFTAMLKKAGFVYRDSALIDASDYGVPQVRKRFILVASRHGPISLPAPDQGEKATVRQAIERFGQPYLGPHRPKSRFAISSLVPEEEGGAAMPPNHVARKLAPHLFRIIINVPKDGGSRADITDYDILLECHKKAPKLHRDVFGRMSWDAPSPTLTCRCADVYCGRFTHPVEDRGISLREAAALQTFPDDYVFYGTFHHGAAQVGNAVPVRLAARLGSTFVSSDSDRAGQTR
jgi:DNA (cytosine-5)-methyltransferase 1